MSTPGQKATSLVRPDNADFWDNCNAGRLTLRRCMSCDELHWYPRSLCPFCLGPTRWEEVSGHGTVYTYSITRRAGPKPYCIAYVDLKEGPRMMTNIVECDLEKVRIGSTVRVLFEMSDDGRSIPMFTLT